MNSNGERLLDNLSAGRTPLRSPVRRYFPIPSPGAFSLGFEYREKRSPGGIGDRLGKMPVLDHALDIETFYGKPVVGIYEGVRNLVAEIKPPVRSLLVNHGDKTTGLRSTFRTSLSASKALLGLLEKFLGFTKEARSLYLCPIGESGEGGNPHVDADFSACFGKRDGFILDGEIDIPPVVSPSDGKGLDLASYRPMPLDLDVTDVLEVETPFLDLTAVSKGSVGDGIEPVGRFEPRVSGFLAGLDPAEKRLESLVQPTKGLLERTVITRGKGFVFFLELGEKTSRLNGIRDAFFSGFVNLFPLSEGGVVKKAVSVKLRDKSFRLLPGRIEAVFERLEHLLSFLTCNIVLDDGIAHKSNGTNVVTPRPKSWKFLSKVLVFAPKLVRSKSLELLDDKVDRQRRLTGHEDMNVVGHNLKGLNRHINLSRLLSKKSLKVFGNLIKQNGLTILRAPHDVIVDVINTTGRYLIPLHSHKQEYNISLAEYQLNKLREEKAAIPLTAKAISPLAA